MKKWIVRSNGKELKCDLVTAFVSSSFRLKLSYEASVFMIEFKNRDDYLDSRDGGWRNVSIYTVNKKKKIYGQAKFY